MENRFSNIFPGLGEEQAIAFLTMPLEQMEDTSDRYIAAAHLVNFPTDRSISALIAAIEDTNPALDHRIARRKAIETLGRLKAERALPYIRACLSEEDSYTVENAVWAIGEIGTTDPAILEAIASVLTRPAQSYRTIIQVLAKLNYQPALERIVAFEQSSEPPIASAAITAASKLTGDQSRAAALMDYLQHPNVNARRGVLQDLMDVEYYPAMSEIAACPVSVVFRLRAIRHLADRGVPSGAIFFDAVEPSLDRTLKDHPAGLKLVHRYDQTPVLEFLLSELYGTDFGRCYLATQTIIEQYPDAAKALLATYEAAGHNDYGAHYHIVKLLGWLRHTPSYDLIVSALQDRRPQFMKSRSAAAIALAQLGDPRAVAELKSCLGLPIWELKYSCLLALTQLGDLSGCEVLKDDEDWLIRTRASRLAQAALTH
ncbi:HEAT repeat-containing PBS lyase [Gloeobacter kilaueensis JS1]|uniref:HEAT repeat-containing PBS lyase n=2 Tax=Gloeobacter TaxID=33071 RepID=U5QSA6_GLOK1|nr:HEAT repeat-containing PBS lyase [Gloeobacter kilaueensis JS1]